MKSAFGAVQRMRGLGLTDGVRIAVASGQDDNDDDDGDAQG